MPRSLLAASCLLAILALTACGPTFLPQHVRDQLTPDLTLGQVVAQPAAFTGKMTLWGGRVIKTINKPQGSLIEVLELPLDSSGRPRDADQSQGRFIVSFSQFLDPAIYAEGREVSVAGRVAGVEKLPLGQIQYVYALLRGSNIQLWPKRPLDVKLDENQQPPYLGPPSLYWYWSPYRWW